MNSYALFDWDNTLRKGFTIVSWVGYLCNYHVVNEAIYTKLLHQFELYKARCITYQQLSDNTTMIYTQSIAGTNASSLESLAYDFCKQDQDIFRYTRPLLEILKEADIEIDIISGSPKIVLLQYAKQFGINEVYGMDIEVKLGCYTGTLIKDYGADKHEIVHDICRSKGFAPLLAFGDSSADEPLLRAAKHGFLIDKENKQVSLNGTVVGDETTICEVVKSLCS